MAKKQGEIGNEQPPSLPLGHSAHDQHDEARRHGDSDFRFDG